MGGHPHSVSTPMGIYTLPPDQLAGEKILIYVHTYVHTLIHTYIHEKPTYNVTDIHTYIDTYISTVI